MSKLVHVSDEVLADLINDIFRWLEQWDSELLLYGNVDLGGALERFFYFSTVQQPSALTPLLEAATGWRSESAPSSLTKLYDDLVVMNGRPGVLAKVVAIVKSSLRYCRHLAQRLLPQGKCFQPSQSELSIIGFFAINPRFVQFFKEYAEALGKERVVFFCATPEAANTATSMGFAVAREKTDALENTKVKISLTHPLFAAYWMVLQSYLKLQGMIATYRPATLVFAEGTSMEDQLAGVAARHYGIPTIRLQSGRAGVLHAGYRRMAFDKMLCWGEGFARRYRQYTPEAEYVITGSPLVAASADRVAFNAGRVTCAIFTQPINKHINETHYEALTGLATRLLARYDGMRILVRKHPVDKCLSLDALAERYPDKVTLADYRTWPLQRVMESADIAAGFYSTTLSESAACGVIPFILKLDDAHSVFPFPEQYGAAIEVPDVDAAMVWVDKLLNDPAEQTAIRQNMACFASEFFGPQDGKAIERTVNCMLQTAGVH